MRLFKVLAALLMIGALGGGAVWYFDLLSPSTARGIDEDGVYVVERGTLKISLTERGTFRAKNSTLIRPSIRGSAKIEWIIDEGKAVEAGDIVVELDRTEAKSRLEDFQNQVIQFESELKAAETDKVIQEAQNKTDIEKAQLALEVARVERQKMHDGDHPIKERQLDLNIETALSDLSRAKDLVKANEELFKEEFVTKDKVEKDKIALRTAENAKVTAEKEKELYLVHEKPLEIKQKEAAVVEAERAVERADKRAEAQLEAKMAKVRQKELSLKIAKEGLAKQEEILSGMTLTAPASGVVLYGRSERSWRDDDDIKVGSQVSQRTVIATIPDTSEMAVGIEIHEADIRKLKPGMPAAVTSETHRGASYEGVITRIDRVANAGNRWRGDVKKFGVTVLVEGKEHSLRPGTSARVEILVGEASDVLFVPIQAIHAKEGKFFCFVDRGSKIDRVRVRIGRTNETHVEIQKGIEEGDRVLLYDPELLDTDTEGGSGGSMKMEPAAT